jgi:hypothetical protein
MLPGSLIKVDPVDRGTETGGNRVVLLKRPEPFTPDNPTVGTVELDEVGLLIAVVEVETDAADGWAAGGKHLEALVLFGTRLGWNSLLCFSEV